MQTKASAKRSLESGFTDLCYQYIVLHLLSGLHDADDGGFDLMFPVVVHFLPRLLPFRVRLTLFCRH